MVQKPTRGKKIFYDKMPLSKNSFTSRLKIYLLSEGNSGIRSQIMARDGTNCIGMVISKDNKV